MNTFKVFFCFCNSATTSFCTLSLHDALPILILFLGLVIAALLRWHAKGPIWPFWAALSLLVANQVQNGADRKSTRLNSSHVANSYAVFCLKKKSYNYWCFMEYPPN